MINRQVKNERGFTLVEMLVAMTVGMILLGSSIYVYTKQDSLLRDENSNVQLRDFARLAMDTLVPNIRQAGYGFPPGDSTLAAPRPGRGVVDGTATSLIYRANLDNIITYADQDSSASTNNWIQALDPVAAGFAVDDTVVFFDVNNPAQWNLYPVAGVNTGTLVWATGNQNGFNISPVTNNVPVVIHKYHTITINYDAGTQIITALDDMGTNDGGTDDVTTTIANNVSNLTFTYFDFDGVLLNLPLNATELEDMRKVQISLTVVDPNETSKTALLITNVHLRNMGL